MPHPPPHPTASPSVPPRDSSEVTGIDERPPRDQAVRLLGDSYNSGNPEDARRSQRAQAFATLAVADAIDRLTETIREADDQ